MLESDDGDAMQAVLEQHGFELSDGQIALLSEYVRQLWSWNRQVNLTRHLDIETFVARDVMDSWQLAQQLRRFERVLDFGTGGGVPGIVLAILRPDLQISLCESVGKKATTVASIAREMNLPVTVHDARVQECLAGGERFDTLVARAVGPLWRILKWLEPHWNSFGRLLLVKGPKWTEERGQARHLGYLTSLELRRLASYVPAGHDGESVVLAIAPSINQLNPTGVTTPESPPF